MFLVGSPTCWMDLLEGLGGTNLVLAVGLNRITPVKQGISFIYRLDFVLCSKQKFTLVKLGIRFVNQENKLKDMLNNIFVL